MTGIPYLAGFNNTHTHLDAHRIFANQVIKNSVYGGSYNSYDLDTISKAILGDNFSTDSGKYKGLSGPMFESLNSRYEQEQYVMQDAILLMNCIAHNKWEILKVLNSLANLTGLSFRDVCNSKGVTKIWTPILDGVVDREVRRLGNEKEDDITRCDTLLNYLEKKISYEDRIKMKQEEEIEESISIPEDEDPDQNQDQNQDHKTSATADVRYIGGWVMTPIPGEYKNVSVFDVTSLYPMMIVNNNISFETVDCVCCNENSTAKIPDYIFDGKKTNRHICTKYFGVLTKQIMDYMNKRIEYKRLAKQLVNDNDYINREEQIREYEIISNAYKILINSAYGQLGHKFAKYENVMAAELVTRYGRATIQYCAKIAKEVFHWAVIYGDTDSLFVNNSENISDADIKTFVDICQQQMHVNMELDKIYEKLLIAGAKNYVGIIKDSKKIVIKGLAGKKSDRCAWVRNSFKEMLNDYRDGIN
ncbi:MAG: DNA polymerase domain-containing protein, partial [Nitrososphaeraceae archaeon]